MVDGINPADLEERLVGKLCARATFAPGDELRRKGNHYSDMYLIVAGHVDVLLEQDAEPIVVGPGSPIGEIGFLRGCRATATAVDPAPSDWGQDTTLQIGDNAPAMTATTATGEEINLGTWLGKRPIVVSTYRAFW